MDWNEFVGVIVSVFLWAGTTLALDGKVLGMLIFLLTLDALTGFIKAIVLKRATSKELIYGLGKKLLIVFVPISISAAAIIAGQDITTFITIVYSVLAFGEAYSVLANIIAINTRKEIEEFDALAIIANGLRKILQRSQK